MPTRRYSFVPSQRSRRAVLLQVRKLSSELAEYKAESKAIKNQDLTIRKQARLVLSRARGRACARPGVHKFAALGRCSGAIGGVSARRCPGHFRNSANTTIA